MNDLKTLHEAWGAPEAPSHTAYTQARAALLDRATERAAPARQPSRRRRRGVRFAAVGACGLTIATGLVFVQNLGGSGPDGRSTPVVPGLPSVPVAAAEVLERAAAAAEKQPFTPPRDDQWFYFEDRWAGSDGVEPEIQRRWRRADGGGMAWIDENGKLRIERFEPEHKQGRVPPKFGPLSSYEAAAALPADPDALLRWAYDLAKNITGGGVGDDGDVYLVFEGMLGDNILPPELQAAIFRAMKQIPGVTVTDTVDVLGRPALALGLTEDGSWLHQELLLDKETYAYRGQTGTVVRDATISPEKAGNSTGEIKKGHKAIAARVTTAIVDEPGQRR